MKKIFSSVTVLFILLSTGKAQNTSPFWSLAGNSNAAATSKLGTTTAIPLRLFTNNAERLRIQTNGRVGIGTTNPVNIFTVKATTGTPAASWVTAGVPVFVGFAEAASSEFYLASASNTFDFRPVFSGKRSRGTLAVPAAVVNNDYITSFTAAAHDGSTFLSPAAIHFYVDGAPSGGHVPARISFETGTNRSDRLERLKILNNGDFNFNDGQVYLKQSTGFLGIGTTSPDYKLHVTTPYTAVYGNSTSGSFGVWGNSTYIGVYGTSSDDQGVRGSSTTGYGVYGSSSTTYTNPGAITGVYGLGYYGVRGSGTFALYGVGTYMGVSGTGDTYGVYGFNNTGYYSVYGSNGSSTGGYGVYGSSDGSNGYGVYGNASGSGGRGVYGNGLNGVYGNCVVGAGNAVYANANAANAYGVIAVSIQSIGISAYSGNASSYAGYFSGKVYSSGGYTSSDRKLKKDIIEVSNAMNIIKKLQPRHYQFRQDGNYKYMNLPQGSHYGLIAQDVEKVLPNLVADAEFNTAKLPDLEEEQAPPPVALKPGEQATAVTIKPRVTKERKDEIISFKAMNYTELIPIMIKAMQEQQQQIDDQQQKIQELNQQVSQLLTEKNINSTLSNIILEQNSPNPYNHSTGIRYAIPSGFKTAQLVVTDHAGKRIKQLKLTSGSGVVNLDGSLLSSGAYSYSLVIDGKIVETKTMLVAK